MCDSFPCPQYKSICYQVRLRAAGKRSGLMNFIEIKWSQVSRDGAHAETAVGVDGYGD